MRKLPFILQCLVRTARKYHLVLDAPHIPMHIRERMHVWSHPAMLAEDQWRGMGRQIRCLRTHHEVSTIEDLEEIAELDESEHDASSECRCENCATDRSHGCRHPSRCQSVASELLGAVAEKWNTSTNLHNPESQLAPIFEDSRESALTDGELLVFDDASMRPTSTSDMYRICVDTLALMPKSAAQTLRAEAAVQEATVRTDDVIHVILCAALRRDKDGNLLAGFAAHYPDKELADSAHACADRPGTYTGAIVLAILTTVELVPPGATLHIITPAKAVVKALTTELARNVATGWMDWQDDSAGMRTVAAALRARKGDTTFLHIDKKKARHWPEVRWTTSAAKVAARESGGLQLQQSWMSAYDVPGISVRGLRQRTAHRAIRRADETRYEPRWTTAANIAAIQESLRSHFGRRVTAEQIWRDLQSPNLSRKTRNFLWKGIHGAHKIGDYFAKMPEPWRTKKDCPSCGTIESMEHILFHCADSAQDIVWDLARSKLQDAGATLVQDLGCILGVASVQIRAGNGRRDKQAEQSACMVVSESAFLIWKLRCTKRIEHAEDDWSHSPAEVRARWESIIAASEKHAEILARRTRRAKAPDQESKNGEAASPPPASPPNYAILLLGPGVLVGPGTQESAGVG